MTNNDHKTQPVKRHRQTKRSPSSGPLEPKRRRAVKAGGTGHWDSEYSDHRQAEEALRESANVFRGFMEQSEDAVMLANEQGNVIQWGPGAERLTGYSRAETIGTPLWDVQFRSAPDELRSPEYYENLKAALQAALLNGQASFLNRSIEATIVRPDGARLTVQSSAFSIPTPKGFMLGGILRDISERRRAEEEISSLAKFPSENPNPVLRLSGDGIIMYANPAGQALLRMWGCEVGSPAPLFWRELAAQVLLSGELAIVETECVDKTYSMVVTPITESAYVNLYGSDITGRKHAEEKIEKQLHQLSALQAVDAAISSSPDMRVSFNILLAQAINELHVDAAAVLLLNNLSSELEYGAGVGFRGRGIAGLRLKLGEGYAGQAALQRRIISVPNLEEAKRLFSSAELLAEERFEAFFAAPLVAKGQVKGVLELFHRASLNPDPEWLDFLETLAGQAAIAIDSAQLFTELQRSNIELALAYDSTIEGWSRAMDLRDKETEGHTQRVAEATVKLARVMGLPERELMHLRRGALLHDMGKMGVPDAILLKAGPLTEADWMIMRQHPTFAYQMLAQVLYLQPAVSIPYCHHEKWDGTGYPRGLKGEQIPLPARIFAVIDAYDALTSDRPYRLAWSAEKAQEYIRSESGKHFDPRVVEAFLNMPETDGPK